LLAPFSGGVYMTSAPATEAAGVLIFLLLTVSY
jgi:hypothetical protein